MGATPMTAFGTVDRKVVAARARASLARLGVDIDPSALIAELSVAELQFVEIARALTADLQLLILDEPTSALTPAEVEKLFRIVRGLGDCGTSVVLITHRLEELDSIADEPGRDRSHDGRPADRDAVRRTQDENAWPRSPPRRAVEF
jgi:rhamnose transport system ATP-binding protein